MKEKKNKQESRLNRKNENEKERKTGSEWKYKIQRNEIKEWKETKMKKG